jgi:hypothetical protein
MPYFAAEAIPPGKALHVGDDWLADHTVTVLRSACARFTCRAQS